MSKLGSGLFLVVAFVLVCSASAKNDPEGLMVDCSKDGMVAILDLKKYPYVDLSTMTLTDSSCKPKSLNSTHAVFEVPLDGCGTTSNSSTDYLFYYNSIEIEKKRGENDTIITREHNATFSFHCAYEKTVILSVVSFSPRKKLVYTKTADFGNFTFTMDLFKSDEYKEAYDSYPVIQYLGQLMYIGVEAISKDSELVLFPQRCFATPTNDAEDAKFYNFIDKGCTKDDTMEYKYDKESSKQQFSLEAFRFISGGTDRVHLHCDVIVCRKSDSDSVCSKGCQDKTRRRRAVTQGAIGERLTVGPLDLSLVQAANGSVAKGSFTVTTIAIIAGCLAFVALVLVAAIAFVVLRRRGSRGGASTLLVQEE